MINLADTLIDIDYLVDRLGQKESDHIVQCIEIIMEYKNKPSRNDYKKAIKEYLSYFDFEVIEDDEIILGDVLMEKHLVLHDIQLTRNMIIAFARCGIIVIQKD